MVRPNMLVKLARRVNGRLRFGHHTHDGNTGVPILILFKYNELFSRYTRKSRWDFRGAEFT